MATKITRVLLVAVLALLVIGVSAGVASKKPLRASKGIQSQNHACDNSDNGLKKIGHVDFSYKASKNSLAMAVNLTGALGNTTYTFYVLDAGSCTTIGGAVGTLRTKHNGTGRISLTADVTGSNRFVLDAHDGTNDNNSRVADFS